MTGEDRDDTETPARRDVTRYVHDWADETSLSTSIAWAITEGWERDPDSVPPLYESIDPDALDDLFAATRESGATAEHVRFQHGSAEITVYRDGEIVVVRDTEERRARDA